MAELVLDEAEIVVVGAGPAGSIAAFTLASMGRDVLLIDRDEFPREKACGDGLTHSAVTFLTELGLDDALDGAQSVAGARLLRDWGVYAAKIKTGAQVRGCCVRRSSFDKALRDHALRAGARAMLARVEGPLRVGDSVAGVRVSSEGRPGAVLAREIVAADGATSRLRKASFGSVGPEAARGFAARRYVEFDAEVERLFDLYIPAAGQHAGYGWVFPVSERVANVGVGYLTARGLTRAQPLTTMLDEFLVELFRHRRFALGDMKLLSATRGGPLGIGFVADRCQAGNITFVGDAARTCDPLTGEGIDQAMRGAHLSALALHRSITSGAGRLETGRMIAQSDLRLGQDSAMIARVGWELMRRRGARDTGIASGAGERMPCLAAAKAMLLAEVSSPSVVNTPAGKLGSRHGLASALERFDDRMRAAVASPVPLVAELLYREICSGLGPTCAVALLALCVDGGIKVGAEVVEAAACMELLRAYSAMVARAAGSLGDEARLNNMLALGSADLAVVRASSIAAGLGTRIGALVAEGIEVVSVAAVERAQAHETGAPGADLYIEQLSRELGATMACAAAIAAVIAGRAITEVKTLWSAGESLGVATQVCEEITALAEVDRVMGRWPWQVLASHEQMLPVVLAIEEQPALAAACRVGGEEAHWRDLVDRVWAGRGVDGAIELCTASAGKAKAVARSAGLAAGAFAALCDLPTEYASAVSDARYSARARDKDGSQARAPQASGAGLGISSPPAVGGDYASSSFAGAA